MTYDDVHGHCHCFIFFRASACFGSIFALYIISSISSANLVALYRSEVVCDPGWYGFFSCIVLVSVRVTLISFVSSSFLFNVA